MSATISSLKPPLAPSVEARMVSKSHVMDAASVEVLHGVSLSISRGDFVAITGPSGSGKSTLLSLLGMLDTPTSGEIFINGNSTCGLAPNALASFRNAHIGFVFQHFHLLPRTRAIEQVILPALYSRNVSDAVAYDFARQKLRDVGLEGYERHMPSQLSGGQQQRVSIARALMNNPSLILADEPTGALDQASGQQIMALMQELNSRGMTVVIVTHDPAVAQCARRVVHMCDGHIIANTPAQSSAEPLKALA